MAECIDYYFSLNSPFTYLGHQRFAEMAARHGLAVRPHPVDFAGMIFPATGGLPVGKRSPQRQSYRLVELARWRKLLDVPLNISPEFWPADEVLAAHMVLAARESGGGAMRFAGSLMRAVWAEERNIADGDTLLTIAGECDLDGESLMTAAEAAELADFRASESKQAIDRGVFGAPTYIYKEQPFWGQDRLDLLERAIK